MEEIKPVVTVKYEFEYPGKQLKEPFLEFRTIKVQMRVIKSTNSFQLICHESEASDCNFD